MQNLLDAGHQVLLELMADKRRELIREFLAEHPDGELSAEDQELISGTEIAEDAEIQDDMDDANN